MSIKSAKPTQKLEQTAKEMRGFVQDAQRKLLEFEVMMSLSEIQAGKSASFTNADELLKELE